jgi:hypothetical protein
MNDNLLVDNDIIGIHLLPRGVGKHVESQRGAGGRRMRLVSAHCDLNGPIPLRLANLLPQLGREELSIKAV